MNASTLETSEGYTRLLAAVERDERESPGFHNYRAQLAWIIDRANHYAEKTGLPASEILDKWEAGRTYWYMNYYQECNQPKIEAETARVFSKTVDLLESIGKAGFRCPSCSGVSNSPYECSVAPCDWKVYGLFGHMGKGVFVFVVEEVKGESIFMPIAWEKGEVHDGAR